MYNVIASGLSLGSKGLFRSMSLDAFASVTKKAVESNCPMFHQKSIRGQNSPSPPWRTLDMLELLCFLILFIDSVLEEEGQKEKKNQNPFLLKFTSCKTLVLISGRKWDGKISPRPMLIGRKKSNEGTTTVGSDCSCSAGGM